MGGDLFSPLCGQLSCRSCLETAARQEKPEGGSRGGRLSVCLKFFSNVNVAAPSSVNFVDSIPPKGKACNKASNFVDREDTNNSFKLMRPLIFQKFLPEYSENQKWAAHNMLRPSFVAVRRHFPPKGKA